MKKIILLIAMGFLSACNFITQPPVGQSPQITLVKPRVAAPGDLVTISGSGFDTGASVKIGSQTAKITTLTTNSIIATMPTLVPNDYTVTVSNPNQKSDTKPGPSVLGVSTQTSDYIDGEVLVTLDSTTDESKLKSLAAQNGFTVLKFIPAQPGSVGACSKGYAVLKDATQGRSTKDAINKIADQSEVYDADPHTSGRGDAYIDSGPTTSQKPELDGISAARAYILMQSKNINLSSIRVAVLDTGVSTHYEFMDTFAFQAKNLEAGRNFTPEDNVLDPRVGSEDVSDMGRSQNVGVGGHGTGVAAIIAAIDDNANGQPANVQSPMVGGAAGATIVPVKVCTKDNKCLGSDVIAGLCYAINQKVSVINLSFGGDTPSHSLKAVLETASTQGISVVAAAGNDGDSAPAHYPAAYSSSIAGLIAVGSATLGVTAPIWSGSDFSIPGAWVDLVAPGKNIYTATVNPGSTFEVFAYGNLEGTSFAAPWVSATAVMLKGLHPDWTPAQIKTQIVSKAKPLSCSSLIKCGAGLLNMADAVVAP
jgi:Subtilase family/IPT/TIG domain